MMKFVFLNLGTNRSDVDAALPSIAAAIAEQLNGPFSAAHGGTYSVRVGSSPTDFQPDEVKVNIRDSIPEAPGAAGYHQNSSGVPDIEIGLDTVDSMTSGASSLSVVLSHECLEAALDPGANRWADQGNGVMSALEACDRVEESNYAASNGVSVSNFLLPAAFQPGAPAPWDYMNVTTSPNQIAQGGYDIQCSSPSDAHDVTASAGVGAPHGKMLHGPRFIGELPTGHRLARKSSPYSRTTRRGVKLAA